MFVLIVLCNWGKKSFIFQCDMHSGKPNYLQVNSVGFTAKLKLYGYIPVKDAY